jgi:two-component system sensor histidine kinase RegB
MTSEHDSPAFDMSAAPRPPSDAGIAAQDGLRAQTLVNLRWSAVFGQLAAILAVAFGLGFALPLMPVLTLVMVSVLLNVAMTLRYPSTARLGPDASFGLLAYDLLQLAGLLFFTGGIENPFSMLLIVPVVISASSLPLRRSMMLGGLVIGVSSLLAGYHLPLPWHPGEAIELPRLYLAATWTAVLATLAFAGVYAWRVAEEARALSFALAATELALTREQHLSQLDGIAAAAAHELGTPLATITLVVKEMQRDLSSHPDHAEDIALLAEQTQRCRDILSKIGSLSEDNDTPFATHSVTELVQEASAPHEEFGIQILIASDGEGHEPIWRRNPGLSHGLGNIIENAVDFAKSQVDIDVRWSDRRVQITVSDDGPGFPPEKLPRIGDPVLASSRDHNDRQRGDADKGLGLGLFIAKTLIERTGGQLHFANNPHRKGAVVSLSWSRSDVDQLLGIPGQVDPHSGD